MDELKLLITFDYELPLGGFKSLEKALFEPAARLIKLANELKFPIVLFADVCSASRLKEWNNEEYVKGFTKQLQTAIKYNHDVQLHIHPHWLDSRYEDGKLIPSQSYSLSDFANNSYPNNIEGILERAYTYLTEICREKDPAYKCIAYRGGGYNLAPKTDEILSSLLGLGVKFDSSIMKGYYFKSDINQVDYRKMPSMANWYILPQKPLYSDSKEGLFEIPIAGKPQNIFSIFFKKIRKKINKNLKARRYENTGKYHMGSKISIKDMLINISSPLMLTFDDYSYSVKDLSNILEYNIEKYINEKIIYICANSHIKLMGDYHLFLLKEFVLQIREKYNDLVEFSTYRNIYDKIDQKE